MSILLNILLGVYLFVALLMILVILMQRPKSEGLGAAFGGGVTENIFGAQTTNVLTKITGWLAAIFFLLTFILSILYAQKGNKQSDLRREIMKNLPPAVSATPTPATSSATPTPGGTSSPGESPAVSPSGTATNSTPPASSPAASVKPADLAVGAVPPATSPASSATSPAASAPVSASPKP